MKKVRFEHLVIYLFLLLFVVITAYNIYKIVTIYHSQNKVETIKYQ